MSRGFVPIAAYGLPVALELLPHHRWSRQAHDLNARAPATPPTLWPAAQEQACRFRVTARLTYLYVLARDQKMSVPYLHHTKEITALQGSPYRHSPNSNEVIYY